MSLKTRKSQGSGGRKGRELGCQEDLLRLVIQPGHPDNPWSSEMQLRNFMAVTTILDTGVRCAEFLNLHISDIDLSQKTLDIRGGGGDSPPRRLHMTPAVADAIHSYIMDERSNHEGAGYHDFLAICGDGSPLSPSAYNDIFTALRDKVTAVWQGFSASHYRATCVRLQLDHANPGREGAQRKQSALKRCQ